MNKNTWQTFYVTRFSNEAVDKYVFAVVCLFHDKKPERCPPREVTEQERHNPNQNLPSIKHFPSTISCNQTFVSVSSFTLPTTSMGPLTWRVPNMAVLLMGSGFFLSNVSHHTKAIVVGVVGRLADQIGEGSSGRLTGPHKDTRPPSHRADDRRTLTDTRSVSTHRGRVLEGAR